MLNYNFKELFVRDTYILRCKIQDIIPLVFYEKHIFRIANVE